MRFGPYDVQVVRDGSYLLDGGSMFGVVPRVLWEGAHPPDQHHRIELALNCLLVRGDGRVIVVETGIGDHWTPHERDIYGPRRPHGGLVDQLRRCGVAPGEVTDVVLTHLHFDHSGGAITWRDGTADLTFPNATHWVQQQNLEWAVRPSERDRRSFRGAEVTALQQQPERLRTVRGPGQLLPGITAMVVSGHTPGQQVIRIGDDESSVLFCGDLIPFASHVRLPWIAAFDLHPLLTLEEKKQILAQASAEHWVLAFYHDPVVTASTVEFRDGVFVPKDRCSL